MSGRAACMARRRPGRRRRHHQVEDDQVGRVVERRPQPPAVVRRRDHMSRCLEGASDEANELRLVVDDKNSRHKNSPESPTAAFPRMSPSRI